MIDLEKTLRLLAGSGIEFVIIGGIAGSIHGSAQVTFDLDVCYERGDDNLKRLAETLSPLHPQLRGAPAGLNFTLRTDLGDLDLIGEVPGVGAYEQVRRASVRLPLFGVECTVLSLDGLIAAKRAAGRAKDMLMLPELEALRDLTRREED